MRCAWKEFLAVLPPWMRPEADSLGRDSLGRDSLGRDSLRELRLRLGQAPELVLSGGSKWLSRAVSREDLKQCVNNASRYSPWNAATVEQGYITAPGGHRIGLCGEAVCKNGAMVGIREVNALCIRIARDIPGIAGKAAEGKGSVLILGAPGWGKTTLLRDLIRRLSDGGAHIAVVDERGELFPPDGCFPAGKCTDVMTGCLKAQGIETVLRTMGPDCVAVDEITAQCDCEALLHAANCGVRLLATAHAASMSDFRRRGVYKPLVEGGVFQTVVILRKDKSYILERMDL